MSFKNLGNKQTIVLHNCEIDNKKKRSCNHSTSTNSWIHSNKTTNNKKKNYKQTKTNHTKTIFKKKNEFSESEANNSDELYKLKESIDKSCPIHDQLYFSDSETTSNSSKRRKRRIKKQYKHKPVHLYNWNQPIRHNDSYILTVIKRKNEPHSK